MLAGYEFFISTYAGSVALFVMARTGNVQPFSILSSLSPGPHAMWAKILDMLGSCLLGSYLVYTVTSPASAAQAAFVGLGMSGLLSAISRKAGGET